MTLFIKKLFLFTKELFLSIFLIIISFFLAFGIGSTIIEVPCDAPDCSMGSNDTAIGLVALFLVGYPSLIWLCIGELYIHLRKRKLQSRIVMLIFPSIYAVLIMNAFLLQHNH
jgi:hypothetical protein